MSKKTKIITVILIVVLAAASRLVKHPFNFTPIAAMALFAGAYLEKKWAIILPLLAMLISDYFIGFYDWQVMASVYVSIALAFAIGRYLKERKKWHNIVLSALVTSITFFTLTNLAVWVFFDWYPHTWVGLANCFVLAIPFFKNTLIGDIFYTVVLFGAYELILLASVKKAVNIKEA